MICGKNAAYHHVKTFGSGGKTVPYNLIPLCVSHHNDIHARGTNFFASKFPSVKKWLLEHGWEFEEFSQKWKNYTLDR